MFRFIHRIIGGGSNNDAPANLGARAAVWAAMLVATDRASVMPPANQSL
jgi:hypothetical protein